MYGTLYIFRDDKPLRKDDLKPGVTKLGRDKATVTIPLDDEFVSRLHVEIDSRDTICTVTSRSANGTQLNGNRLTKDVPYPLKHTDTLTIGPFTIRFIQPQRPVPPPPPIVPPVIPPIGKRTAPQVLGWESSYWPFLPPFYRDTDAEGVLNAILLICETMLAPIDDQIRLIDRYFDPLLAPAAMLPWLAFWVDAPVDDNTKIEQTRALIARAGELHPWRGTRRSLREYVTLVTKHEPIIIEPGQEQAVGAGYGLLVDDLKRILKIKHPSELATDLRALIERRLEPNVFRVIALLGKDHAAEAQRQQIERVLRQLLDAEKPVHTSYELDIYMLTSP